MIAGASLFTENGTLLFTDYSAHCMPALLCAATG